VVGLGVGFGVAFGAAFGVAFGAATGVAFGVGSAEILDSAETGTCLSVASGVGVAERGATNATGLTVGATVWPDEQPAIKVRPSTIALASLFIRRGGIGPPLFLPTVCHGRQSVHGPSG
jgi:hypothetical protein